MRIGNKDSWIYVNEERIKELTHHGYQGYFTEDLPINFQPRVDTRDYSKFYCIPNLSDFLYFLRTMENKKEATKMAKRAGLILP